MPPRTRRWRGWDSGVDALFVLAHSPLVGPSTWSLVAAELGRRGIDAIVPSLRDREDSGRPYWRQHAESVASALRPVPRDRPLALVRHSGAGPLLPAIRRLTRQPVAACIFVDAGLPHDGMSRLDAMGVEDPAFARELREHLASGGRFPEWGDEDLREAIPDDHARRAMLAELRPRPLAFFEEPIPGSVGELDAPRGYLRLSAAYGQPAEQARQDGWAYRAFDAGHFHMLVDPIVVTNAIVGLVQAASPRVEH